MANMCGLTAIHSFQTADSRSLMDHPPSDWMSGISELSQGVNQRPQLHGQACDGGLIDGHAPLLWGNALNGYNTAVIRIEQEVITAEEAIEKLRKRMPIRIREGAGAAVE
jgi:adenine deaminase